MNNPRHSLKASHAEASILTPLILGTLVLASLVLTLTAGCSRGPQGSSYYTEVAKDDEAMNAAIAKAKASANEFLEAYRAKKPETKEFYVKKSFPTPGGGEHMWVEVLEEKDGVMKGRVANEPEETREVKFGQTVSVNISEISDWKYHDGKKLVGGYTIRYLVDKMTPKEKAEFLKEAGFEL